MQDKRNIVRIQFHRRTDSSTSVQAGLSEECSDLESKKVSVDLFKFSPTIRMKVTVQRHELTLMRQYHAERGAFGGAINQRLYCALPGVSILVLIP